MQTQVKWLNADAVFKEWECTDLYRNKVRIGNYTTLHTTLMLLRREHSSILYTALTGVAMPADIKSVTVKLI